ncbi:MAG: ECF transporter S component [Candidatus Hodarchaeales archaeon]|jgi:uncharacterized membrane protein
MVETNSPLNRILAFFRVESNKMIKNTLGGSVIGFSLFFIFEVLKFPQFTFSGIDVGITVIPIIFGIDLTIIVIAITACFFGPLAGFLVGFLGSLTSDLFYTHQIVAMGGINFAFGMLGFIIGIPRYTKENGFANGKELAKLMLFSFLSFIVMSILLLGSLMIILQQSFIGTILYNFIPFLSIWLISLLIFTPVIAWIAEMMYNQAFIAYISSNEEG